MTVSSTHGPEDFNKVFSVSRETIAKLKTYAQLLHQWQPAVQLVAPSTLSTLWDRHFVDSAQLLHACPQSIETWIDFGSGGGFPGLIIALMAGDETQRIKIKRVILIESDTRKAAFLKEVARQLGLAVDIFCGRIETVTTQAKVGRGDVVSARACAPLVKLLSSISPYWKSKTLGLFLKGADVKNEIIEAYQEFKFELELIPSITDSRGHVLKIWNLEFKTRGASSVEP